MSREPSTSALRDLRALFDLGNSAGLSDAQLLRRYVDRRAEADSAFSSLVDRHGPMVWGVCRRALGGRHEAEDAFQATFLVLARRADSVRVDGSLGRWLHGVASKVASRARHDGLRRRTVERRAARVGPSKEPHGPEREELLAALDEELGRLPEKYRSPVVLCHLEGLTYAGAAEQLGCPPGAVKARLGRARELLRARLARRGLGLPASASGALILPGPRPVVPPSLAASTARVASAVARPAAFAGASATAFSLARGVTRTMFLIRWTKWTALLAPAPALLGLWLLAPHPPSKGFAAQPPAARARTPAAGAKLVADEPDRATAIAGPLPEPDDLRKLLRRAAEEAIALAPQEPEPTSWALQTLAKAQAMAGDVDGARATFAVAVRQAGGELGGLASSWHLWYVAHFQVEAGFRDEARVTLGKALEHLPEPVRDFDLDSWTLHTLAEIVKELAGSGARDEAKRAAERLATFAAVLLVNSEVGNAEEVIAADIAEALAAVDDFEGAFRRAGVVQQTDQVLGKAAVAAARYLDRDRARRYVAEAVARMARITLADQKYFGLGQLAEAQALIGDDEGAKKSARGIGEGPSRVDYDMTDGQPLAMLRIANVQRRAGHAEAARETLREAYRMIVDHPRMRDPEGRLLQVAEGQVIAGDVGGALRSAAAMPEGRRAQALAQVARAQAIAGKGDDARKTIDRALADTRVNLKNPPPPKLEFLLNANIKPSPGGSVAIIQLAETQAMAGDVPEALKSLATLEDENQRRFALERVVAARAAAGDVRGALDLATRNAKTPRERRSTLEGLGQGVDTRLILESSEKAGR